MASTRPRPPSPACSKTPKAKVGSPNSKSPPRRQSQPADAQPTLRSDETHLPGVGERTGDRDDTRPRRNHDERESGRHLEGAASGEWAIVASSPLAEGFYTAVATEPSAMGNGTGESETRSFEVVTKPPEVTLEPVPTPSNDTNPSFSGTANETKNVVVKVYKGAGAEGTVVATAEAAVSGGEWHTSNLATKLESATYTAVAGEESSLGNGEGPEQPGDLRGRHVLAGGDVCTAPASALERPARRASPARPAPATERGRCTSDEGTKAEGTELAKATAVRAPAARGRLGAGRARRLPRANDTSAAAARSARQQPRWAICRRQIQRGHVRRRTRTRRR